MPLGWPWWSAVRYRCVCPSSRHDLRKIPTFCVSLSQTVQDTYAIVSLVKGWEAAPPPLRGDAQPPMVARAERAAVQWRDEELARALQTAFATPAL